MQVEIAQADDEEAGDLRFWLSIDSDAEEGGFERIVDADVRRKLERAGAKIARVLDLGKKTMAVIRY